MIHKIYQLIYRSKAQPNMKQEQIRQIIDEAIAFNAQVGITGCLVSDRGYFLQLLEGEKNAVDELYKKIKIDSRHSQAEILSTGYTKNRIFESWKMGYVEMLAKTTEEKEELARNAKKELELVSTKDDFTSKVFWYNVHSLLKENLFYK
jgi:hypothetical protein